jgi:hypothetical protein
METKKIVKIIVLAVLVLAATATAFYAFKPASNSAATSKTNTMQELVQIFAKLKKGSKYKYTARSVHPGGEQLIYDGCITLCGDNFRDSNNFMFSFVNKKWALQAVHSTKMLRMYNIEKFNEKLGENTSVDFSTSLLSMDTGILNAYNYQKTSTADTNFITISPKAKMLGLQAGRFAINPHTQLPYYYQIIATYTDRYVNSNTVNQFEDYDAEANEGVVTLDYRCYAISELGKKERFDETNYIDNVGSKMKSKVYLNYQIYYSKN